MTKTLFDFSLEELQQELLSMGAPKFTASQIFDWIYKKKIFNPAQMTNLSKAFREKISATFDQHPLELVSMQTSSDGTKKFLWKLADDELIESVIMDHENHRTACISSQAGCPLSCTFCATGMDGLRRNLTIGEIVAQFLFMEQHDQQPIQNIVFMGMGEPLLNYDNIIKAITLFTAPKARGLGNRHITISTSGVADKIRALADSPHPNTRLCISLHAPNDELRSRLMPINKTWPLTRLIPALKDWQNKTGIRLTVEYILIKNQTDLPELAYELVTLLDGLKYYVNLIPYNPTAAMSSYQRPSASRITPFAQTLRSLGVEVEIRREKGSDINAACGQLRAKEKLKIR